MSLIGTENNGDNQTTVFEQLVGEGKKFNDQEALAKGKQEADDYIEKLKLELEAERRKNAEADYAKELLEKLRDDPSKTLATTEASDPKTEGVDLKSMIAEEIEKRDAGRSAQQNIDTVNDQLLKAFGDKAGEVVQNKAKELGVSLDFLNGIAAKSSSAFLKLIADESTKEVIGHQSSSLRTDDITSANEVKGWQYYNKLRKENPTLYRSAAIIKEIDEAMVRMGSDAFFKS